MNTVQVSYVGFGELINNTLPRHLLQKRNPQSLIVYRRLILLFDFTNRWAVTFLDLAANVPKLSIKTTTLEGSGQDNSLTTVHGRIGVVAVGVEIIRGASAACCIQGNFSLAFNGITAIDIDLDDNGTKSSDFLREGLQDVINQGK